MSLEDIDCDDDYETVGTPTTEREPSYTPSTPTREDRDTGSGNRGGGGGGGGGGGAPPPKGFVHLTKEQLETDWYEVLQAPHDATESELKKAYQKRCLDTHPDKDASRDDTHFKQVVAAYAVLGNPELRRAFDSAATFDDNIPAERAYTDDEFFTTFGRCFDRNRKWSVNTAPRLGGKDDSDEAVQQFYDFWFQFKSWRDFSHKIEPVEYDDDCREIRRKVQRENDKMVEKLKKAEAKRVMTLVERAFKSDPRVKAKQQREKQERERIAQEKALEKQLAEEKAAQEKRDAEAALKAAEEEKKAAAKEAAAKRKQLRISVCEVLMKAGVFDNTCGESMAIREDKVLRSCAEWVTAKSENLEQLLAVVTEEASKGSPESLVALINKIIQETETRLRLDRYGQPYKPPGTETEGDAKPAPKAAVKDEAGDWNEEHLTLLQKAIAKYPGGTVDRWAKMSAFMGNTHTEKQVLLKTRELDQCWNVLKSATTTNGGVESHLPDAWSAKQQKQLEDALRSLKEYKEKDKWDKIAEAVEGKSKSECVARYKYLAGMQGKK